MSVYYKTPTIHLDNIATIILQKAYQFASSGPWQVFAVAIVEFIHIVYLGGGIF